MFDCGKDAIVRNTSSNKYLAVRKQQRPKRKKSQPQIRASKPKYLKQSYV